MKVSQISSKFLIENNPEGVVIKKNKKFYYSSFMVDQIDQYLADNYDLLKAEGALDFHIESTIKRTNEWTVTETDYIIIGTFPAFTDAEKKLEDFDIGVSYKRFFIQKTLTDIDGQHGIESKFYIVFDSSSPDEMELSILTHYYSFLSMGVTSVTMLNDQYGISNYASNNIVMSYLLPEPTNIVDPKL
jgi:hypothetical protein